MRAYGTGTLGGDPGDMVDTVHPALLHPADDGRLPELFSSSALTRASCMLVILPRHQLAVRLGIDHCVVEVCQIPAQNNSVTWR